jgi:hypothetical protein
MYTPGPWIIEGPTKNSESYDCYYVTNQGGTPIAELSHLSMPENEANARLIAAAPNMYEAIKEYLEWGAMTGSDRDLLECKFRAAISKAK